MTLTHYIGGKLVGETADFPPSLNYPNLTTFINSETFEEFILVNGVWEQVGAPIPTVGGWKEIGRTTLGSASSLISVTGLVNKRYLQILAHTRDTGGSINQVITLNGDAAANYAIRKAFNGGADGAFGATNSMQFMGNAFSNQIFGVGHLANLVNKEKLFIIKILRNLLEVLVLIPTAVEVKSPTLSAPPFVLNR